MKKIWNLTDQTRRDRTARCHIFCNLKHSPVVDDDLEGDNSLSKAEHSSKKVAQTYQRYRIYYR